VPGPAGDTRGVWISLVVPLALLLLAVLLQHIESSLLSAPDAGRSDARAPGGAAPDPAVPDPAAPLHAEPSRAPLVPVPAPTARSQRRPVPVAHPRASGATS
jgi:hypothetical protein